MTLEPSTYEPIIRRALAEDLGDAGDITTDSIVPADAMASGRVVARQAGIVAGLHVAARTFAVVDNRVEARLITHDGAEVSSGAVLIEVSGPAPPILIAERTALNLLGRMSGIATLVGQYVAATRGTKARIVDTRKTTPGLRVLEKYAVRMGGGTNHRFGLYDAVLIKDNHIALAGSIANAVAAARERVGHLVRVELEVDTIEQLQEGLDAGVDAVLLDNMTPEQLREAVDLVDGTVVTEASGGVTLERIPEIAAAGVDLISVGALTHSAPNFDVGLDL